MSEKFTKFLMPLSIIVAGLFIAGAFIFVNQKKETVLSSKEVGDKVIDFINKNFTSAGSAASLISIEEEGSVYKIRLKVGDNEYDSYATKDGELLFPEAYSLKTAPEKETQTESSSTELPKGDKPDVKLFVMSYCPYGLQAQKMFLPVYNLLKEKAAMGVYFVDYIMHEKKEIDENLRQYCIQKEEKEKYYDYLSCFVKDGDFEKCLAEAGIDTVKLTSCISATDSQYSITTNYNDKSTWLNGRYPKFDIYLELNKQYGVQGSPTIVINDKIVDITPRSPEKFKEVICQAFNSAPEECSQALSNESPSAGLGTGTSSSTGGGCGQ